MMILSWALHLLPKHNVLDGKSVLTTSGQGGGKEQEPERQCSLLSYHYDIICTFVTCLLIFDGVDVKISKF